MRKITVMMILICMLLSLVGCSNKATEEVVKEENTTTAPTESTDYQELAKTYALQMVEGNFKDTHDACSLIVKAQISEEALKTAWDTTVSGMGKFIEVYSVTQEEVNKNQMVIVILRYENNGLKVSFTINKSQKIDGLWLNYSPLEEDAITTEVYSEEKITFGEGEYPISGVLTIPNNVENPPIVILVPGSGNHDVNETVGANKPFQDLAWGLAERGIASIRYNERLFTYPELANTKDYTIELDSLTDASDAIAYALGCEKVNQDQVYVIGHSLGAMMAPKIASDHKEVAGIILLAGSPRKLEDIVYDQVMDAANQTKDITKEQKEEAINSTKKGIETIRNLTKGGKDLILTIPSSYWYSLNQINIPDIAKELTIPMYIAQGSEDFQVFADVDYVQWQELLKDKSDVTFCLYEGLNHLFMTSNGKTDITEYNVAGAVDKKVLDDIAQWIIQ